jgi:hypothetical protein
LAVLMFYMMMPLSLRFPDNSTNTNFHPAGYYRNKYEEYDLDGRPNDGANGAILPNGDYSGSEIDEEDAPPNPLAPLSNSRRPSSPFVPGSPRTSVPPYKSHHAGRGRGHKHTASIASLIRGDERVDEGWGSISGPSGLRSAGLPAGSSSSTAAAVSSVSIPPSPRIDGFQSSKGEPGLGAPTSTLTVDSDLAAAGNFRARSPSWPENRRQESVWTPSLQGQNLNSPFGMYNDSLSGLLLSLMLRFLSVFELSYLFPFELYYPIIISDSLTFLRLYLDTDFVC